jgi:hypothetical protein
VKRSRLPVAIAIAAVAVLLGTLAFAVVSQGPTPTSSPHASGGISPGPTPVPGDATAAAHRGYTVLPGDPPEPAGRALQSRLWVVDGQWFGAMVDPGTRETRIHALDADGASWADTGVLIDERPGAMVDALWADDRLYVVSAVPGRSTANGVRVTRFHQKEDGRFVLDTEFPVALTERGVTATSIARDTAGRLWVATVQDGVVLIAHSTTDDAIWTAPSALPGSGTVGDADVAAVVADGSGRLAVVWSDALAMEIRHVDRGDGDAPDSWSAPEVAFAGLPLADEPISVTALDGTVVVAVQTAVSGAVDAGASEPDSVILVRDPSGSWRTALFARVGDRLGQPIVLIDRASAEVYVFATSPRRGGTVHLKRSSLDRLEFPSGRGLTVIADPSDPRIAYLTSAKSPVVLADGFLIQGFDGQTGFYWDAHVGPPGGVAPTPGVSASPDGSPSATPAASPRTVLFTNGFDAWEPGASIEAGWELGPAGVTGSLQATADKSGDGRHARLRPDAKDAVRACKAFPATSSGRVVASQDVRLDAIGPADAVITSVRDRSGEAASVRFGQAGTFAYYRGGTKIRTNVPIRLDRWYRSVVTVDLDAKTYDWRLADTNGKQVLRVRDIPFREKSTTQVSSICLSSSTAADGIRFDDVSVSR